MVKKLSFVIFIFGILLATYTSQSLASTYAPYGYRTSGTTIIKTLTGTIDYPGQCTIDYSNPPLQQVSMPTPKLCIGALQCRPVPGYGNTCVEKPLAGSVENGAFCYSDSECASGYCFHASGHIGSATCQAKCGPNTCSGGCVVTTTYYQAIYNVDNSPQSYPQDTNQCILPTATPKPTISCAQSETGLPNTCNCTDGSTCASGYCDPTSNTCKAPPASATCKEDGIVTKTYNRTNCFRSTDAKSLTVICNDGATNTFTNFQCDDTFRLDSSAKNFCGSHKTCPTPTPTNTPTPTPTRTPTPTPTKAPLNCDPVPNGQIDEADFDLWKQEFEAGGGDKKTDCFNRDQKVDLLDFQVWRDIAITNRVAAF